MDMYRVNLILPSGQDIMIHKGWKNDNRQHTGSGSSRAKKPHERKSSIYWERNIGKSSYEFVNTTKSKRSDDNIVRRMVRSHVMKGYKNHRRQAHKTQSMGKISASTSTRSQNQNRRFEIPSLFGNPTALSVSPYPFEMLPQMHALLGQYLISIGSRMFPLERCLRSNPFRNPSWFHFAVTDAAMLHAVLYMGAIYLALLQGKTISRDAIYHQNQTITIIQKRLNDSRTRFEDSTLGAISCLATGEAISGNVDSWHIHMKGLKHIIRARGNISSVGTLLRAKLLQSDINGAIDYASTPYLDFELSARTPIWSILPAKMLNDSGYAMAQLLTACQIHTELITTMSELAHFAQTIEFVKANPGTFPEPLEFLEDSYRIEHKLLSFPNQLPNASQESSIENACRIGSLLYMKAILQPFPHSKTGPSILLTQLQQSLSKVEISESIAPLRIWLLLIGAALSSGERKIWFLSEIAQLVSAMQLSSFCDQELEMSRLLSLKNVFGRVVENIWGEAATITAPWQDMSLP